MRHYCVSIDRRDLPALVDGTQDMIAHPRPNQRFVCVIAPATRTVYNVDTDGTRTTSLQVPIGHYCVAPQPGFRFSVHPDDVVNPAATRQPSYRALPQSPTSYEVAGKPDHDDPAASIVRAAWAEAKNLPPTTLLRTREAEVLGQIAPDAEPGSIYVEQGCWRARPGAWILWDASRRNVVVGTNAQLSRMFTHFTSATNTVTL